MKKAKNRKKRFYNDKKRNRKWTEKQTGREISFADKYVLDGETDKFDDSRTRENNLKFRKERQKKALKKFICVVCALILICVGYTGMDVYMTRHAKPAEQHQSNVTAEDSNMSQLSLSISSLLTDSVSLDGSAMLSSVISSVSQSGYSSVTFDAKRSDGTIGYSSKLASVDTFGAISAPATQTKSSVQKLSDSDILPVARICCYRDNVIPKQSDDAAVKVNGKVYEDSDGYTYLNPDSDFVYNYIKDIISELKNYGVGVFVLYGCDLPDEVSGDYNDGYSYISKKLNSDFNGDIKLYCEKDVTVKASGSNSLSNSVKSLEKLGDSEIYYIKTSADADKIMQLLSENSVSRYILSVE